jgi:1,4-dihydroxy-2-naphthoate octaprenyltransferase
MMIPFPVIGVARPNFLMLTPVCICLGLASVLLSGELVDWGLFTVIMLGALMAHVSVNALNEYQDFQSGLDFKTEKTPFSGGTGTLVMQPRLATQALMLALVALGITIVCGLFLMLRVGWGLAPIGLLGVVIILFYTSWINRNRYLVLIAPGLSFGPLMVVGTDYALTGSYSGIALLLSLVPFFMVNNLLLMNQIPDIEADRSVGRDNFAIGLQANKTALLYLISAGLAYLAIVTGVVIGVLPLTALIALITGWLTYQAYVQIREYRGDVATLVPAMGKNVIVTLLTPFLLFIGILIGKAL